MELEQNEVIEQDTTGGETSEETNQDGFLDAFNETEEKVEEAEENKESEDNEDEGESEDAPPQADEQRHRIRVDHQDVDLTLDELKVHAQKGMAFDRLKESYDSIRANADRWLELAERQNISVDELLTQAEIGYVNSVLDNIKNDYIEEGYDEEAAEALAMKDLELGSSHNQPDPEDEFHEQVDAQAAQFLKVYPDVNIDSIPDEVFDRIYEDGMSLIESYQLYEIDRLKAEAAATQQNIKNASQNLGTARDSKRQQKKDDFLSEFMKE